MSKELKYKDIDVNITYQLRKFEHGEKVRKLEAMNVFDENFIYLEDEVLKALELAFNGDISNFLYNIDVEKGLINIVNISILYNEEIQRYYM